MSSLEPDPSPVNPQDQKYEPPPPAIERLVLRLVEVARSLGVSRRALERERSAGRFPKPDLRIGKAPLWSPETIRTFVKNGGVQTS